MCSKTLLTEQGILGYCFYCILWQYWFFSILFFVIDTCSDVLLGGKGNLEIVFPGKALNKGPLHSTKM